MDCKICGNPTQEFDRGTMLGKYIIAYFTCSSCAFTAPEEPFWLDEAYSSAINRYDIGLLYRNLELAPVTQAVINSCFNANGTFLDYGGGYGTLVRIMRDAGYSFYRSDPMCENLFANGYDMTDAPKGAFELVTAFEVFEHLVNPLEEIRTMLRYSDSILFSTMLVPSPPPPLNEWWYYGLEHGQHVSLYSLESLKHIAQQLSLTLHTNYGSIHLLTRKVIPTFRFKWIFHHRTRLLRGLLNRIKARPSLLQPDYERLTGKPMV